MNIYLPIEVKSRELEGKILLALVAAERGHEVLVGSKNETLGLAIKKVLVPGIIHHKSIQPIPSVVKHLKELIIKGHINTTQDEENGLLDEEYDDFASVRFSNETLNQVSKVFCWGQHDYSSLCRIFPKFTNKFIQSGSPRVDYWRNDFSPYYSFKKINKFGEYILIVSNFGYCLNINSLWKTAKFLRDDQNILKSDDDFSRFMSQYAWSIELLSKFIKAIVKLSKLYPNTKFIIRPHPVEEPQAWSDLIGDSKNIMIIKEESIGVWLKEAKGIIYNGCTTALEAAAFGKTIIAYRPLPSKFERKIPNEVGLNVFSEKELLDMIKIIINENNFDKQNELVSKNADVLSRRFSNLTGLLAADIIVNEWEKLDSLISRRKNNWRKVSVYNILHRKLGGLRHVKYLYYLFSFKHRESEFVTNRDKFDNLKTHEVDRVVNGLIKVNSKFETVRYRRVGPRSFRFFKDA